MTQAARADDVARRTVPALPLVNASVSRRREVRRVPVARVIMATCVRFPRATLARTGAAQVEVDRRAVAAFLVEGRLHAIDGTCPHRGGPLGEGALHGRVVTCPWHRWTFDVTTGRCVSHPDRDVRAHEVAVDGDDVVVSLR